MGKPTIPAGSTITAATMTVTMVSGTSLAYTANAYQVTGGEWTSATLQWSNKPAANVLLASNISHNNKTKYQFSCLTAVRHWYTGSTTGQNQNYAIMLRYADETINDYNSFYSADCTDANSRPKLTISYTPPNSTLDVDVGATLTLSVSGATGTVTWTSSNTSVATVNSSGVVTGVKAGKVTITASVNGNVFETFTVYVTVADGVYYIKNTNFAKYLSTTGGVAEQTLTTLKNKSTSGLSQLQQLWKIVYLGNGYYSIRPMYALSMALHATSNTVDIVTVGTTDSLTAVPLVSRWGIDAVSGGYTFKHAGTGSLKMGSYVSYSEYYVTTGNYVSGATASYWTLEKVSSVTTQLLLLDTQTGASAEGKILYINSGETVTLEELRITASFVCGYSLNQSMSWYSENPASVSVDSGTGTITANISDGKSTIYVKHIHNGVEYTKSFKVRVNRQMTQFIDKMGDLYDISYSYEEGNQTKAFETLFNFIRGQRYGGTMWEGIAGEWDTTFKNHIETNYPNLYSYFICESPDDNTEYNTYSVNNSSEDDIYMVTDTCSDAYIDIIHMTATLNRLFYTGETTYFGLDTCGLLDEEADELSGWAGDCQTLIINYYQNENTNGTQDEVYEIFYPMIGSTEYSFTYADIIADMDACNLYMLLSNQIITTGEQFEEVLTRYYFGTVGNVAAKRFTTWIGTYTEDTLQERFYDYCNDHSPYVLKWPFLDEYTIYEEQQEAFSQAFADYFWAQRVKEQN